jgi:surfactin synthase thioesterase subunit
VPAPTARHRLFCVPHSGGGAATYKHWARRLAPDVEVVAVRLPGRETRFREPAHRQTVDAAALMHRLGRRQNARACVCHLKLNTVKVSP